jgi:hypothetical protein
MTNKNKSRICYECHQKGHMDKDCPNGNIPKSNLVNYDFHKLRNDKNETCAIREISSPRYSMRAIWVPKHLVTNPIGPNKCWVPRNSYWACRLKEMHWAHGWKTWKSWWIQLTMWREKSYISWNQCHLRNYYTLVESKSLFVLGEHSCAALLAWAKHEVVTLTIFMKIYSLMPFDAFNDSLV